MKRDDGPVARAVLERAHARRIPHRLLNPLEGVCLPGLGDARFRHDGAVVLGLQLEEELADVLRHMLDRADDRAVAQRARGSHVDEVVGHVVGCDAQVRRGGLTGPFLPKVDAVVPDDGEARREAEVEACRADDG